MTADKSKQVLIRVTPETKEQWEEAADNGGFRGLSGFVRFAVSNEIDGRDDGGTAEIDTEEIADAVETAMADDTDEILRRLSAIETALSGLQEDIDGHGEGTVAAELVIEALPSPEETPKPVEEIADIIGVPTPPVRRTLQKLVVESERVRYQQHESGQRGYYADV